MTVHLRTPTNRGRAAFAALLASLLGLALPLPARAQDPATPQSLVVDTVVVQGNARLTEAEVRTFSGVRPGQYLTALQVQALLRRMMGTGNFESVEARFRPSDLPGRGALVLAVRERPIVTAIEINGLTSVRAGTVRDSAGLREGVPLDPQAVARARQLIADLLAARGVQLLSADTSLTPVPGAVGRVRLAIDVREGNRLAIADIEFRGNQAFDDEALRGAMATKEEGFWWFRTGRFDRDAFQDDLRENLPAFYGRNGYIDFQVLSDTLIVDPASGKARLVVEVNEGPQYRLGAFTVQGNSRFPTDALTGYFTQQRRSVLGLPIGGQTQREEGEVFDRAALDAAADEIQRLYRNEGYLYAQVIPDFQRVPAPAGGGQPTVNATLRISEDRPFYVRYVRFEGNTTTHESVLRDRMWVIPGDVYNEDRVIQSWQSLSGLGFFETPMDPPDIRPDEESGTVDVVFTVRERQTGNINFGTVIGGGYGGRGGGFSGFLGYQQPNLFGQGKTANLRAEYGYGRSTFEASYTDPALFGTRNSGSVSLFRTGDRYFRARNGRRLRTGVSLTYGFPVLGALRTRAFVGYSLSRTSYTAVDDECDDQESLSVFCLPSATASTLSLSLTRDTKNHPIFPTAGTRQSVSVEQTGGPLGGEGNFQKVFFNGEWWVPAGTLGSGPRPIRMAFGVQARAGGVFGDVGLFPFERFYLGGTSFGQPLRGYPESTIGPRGYDADCRSITLDCLGDAFVTVSGEYAVRLNDVLSISAFADAGNVYGTVGQFNPSRLFRGAGVGATLVTPFLGAIGIDAAYGFDRPDPSWEIHFKLGSGF